MQYLLYTILIYIFIAINAGVFPALKVFGAIPQLILLTCAVLSVTEDNINKTLFVALIGGFLWELFTGLVPGSLSVGYLLGVIVVYILSRRVFFLQDRVKYLSLFLAAFQGIVLVLAFIINYYGERLGSHLFQFDAANFFRTALFSFLYNLVLLYPMYFLLAQFERVLVFFKRQRNMLK